MERVLRWESERRYYAVRLHQDLLGQWVMNLCWGGRFNRLGKAETIAVPDQRAGDIAIAQLHARRTKRRYALVTDRRI